MSARTRRGLALSWSALFVLSLLMQYFSFAVATQPVLAVHDEQFQLDGNTVDDAASPQPFDWNNLYPGGGTADAFTFITDGVPERAFEVGDKDLDDTDAWDQGLHSVPDKDDILHAFAALFGDILYFGADRYSTDGDAQVGFWFFKNGIGLTETGFTPVHTVGDLLVVSHFTNGGTTSTVELYEWVGSGGSDGSLDLLATGQTCTSAPADDKACAIANSGNITVPWSYQAKDGKVPAGVIPANGFYEGGLDLADLYGGTPPCFSAFLVETRSSQELTATLKDFATGSFNTCVPPTIATQVDDSTADFGQQVTDTATLSGSDGPASGTVTFFICTPAQITAAGCPSGGTQVGDPVTVNTAANPDTATSAAYTVGLTAAAAGKYCWRAVYTPDAASQYLGGSHTNATTECFTVAPATIEIVKDANPVGPVSAGAAIGFDITVTNNGTNTTLGVNVSDSLPGGVDWTLGATSGSTTGLTCAITGSVGSEVLGCTKPSLAAGASFSVRVTANTDATDCGVINNTANVSTSNDGTDSDPASVTVQCPDIQVTKTPDGTTVDAGGTITWSIKVENLGPGAATGVVLSDTLPTGITWSESEADCSIAAGPPQVLTCTVGSLASGASRTYQVSGTTTKDNCGPVNNTASATATNEPSNVLANNSDSGSVTVLCATVTIDKTADSGTVSAGTDIGFTLTWGNSTGGTATGVVVTDNLPGTAGLNWSIAGSTGTGSTCAITGAVGSQVLTCNVGTIPGNTAVSGTVHIVSGTSAITCSTVRNTGAITTDNDGSATDNASIVVRCPDIHVDKTADTGTINAGELASFTITVSNAGPGVAKNVTLTDNLPAGVVWSENSTSCSIAANVLSCTFASLQPGASVSVTVSGTTDAADCAGLNNTVNVAASNEPQADQSDNSDSASIVVNCPDVHVDKTAGNGTISAGDVASFTITASNAGPGIARSVTVNDTLPAGISWSENSTSCSITTGVLTCNFGDLASGAFASVTVTGTTDAADCGTLNNTANVAATNESVADQADNSDSASIVVNCPDLSVEKSTTTGTISAGETARFTVVITNHGSGVATNVHVADTLPAGVTWTLDPAVPGCSIVGTALTCDFASLLAGQVVTLQINGATVAANCGTLHNVVTVSASNEPSNLLQDNSDSADVVVNCPTILLTKTADDATINAGDPIGFTIEVSNNGLGNATGVHVTDDLPAGITWTADAPTGTASATCSINTAPNPDVLTCDAALMGPGTSFSVHIHGTTAPANCGLVDNEAVVTTTNDGGDDDDAQVVVECPDITVVKTPDGGVVNAGQNAVFTIVVSNSNAEGTGTAYNVTLTDSLPAGYVWTLGGANAASCSINTVPSPDVLSCNFGNLAAGASRTVTLTAPTNGDNCAVIPNVANVAATNEAQSRTGNNSDSASIDVTCPDIEVVKTAESTPIQVGEDLVFTITTTNIGDGVAEDVILTDNLPAGFDWDVDDERCNIAAGVMTCNFGDMDPEDSITITLTAPTSGDPQDGNIDCGESLTHRIPNVASATSENEGEGLLENNSDDAVIVVNCSELFIDKSFTGNTGGTDPDLGVPAAKIGDTLVYSLDYDGAGLLTNAVITDVLPQGLDFVEGSPCTDATDPLPCDTDDPYFDFVGYNEATRTLTWTAATLPDPAEGTVTYDVIVLETAPEFAQPLVNVATIDSDQTPPDSDTASVAVLAPPLELTPPPTSTLTRQTGTSNPGFALMLILLGVAGLTLGIGFVTPVPASVRRRERLG